MLLGDLGADVIKIEQPGRGDETRAWGPPFVEGESPYFWAANRNKRSVTLNLGLPQGRAIFKRLIERSQVLVDNFKVGTLERWGLDDTALWQIQPALVHAAVSAYGTTGPKAQQPGYDFLLQAESGWMSITGEPDGQPMKLGVALVDVLTGLYTSNAILAALRVAEGSGRGQRVDCSLLRSAIAALVNVGSSYLATGSQPQRWGNAHATIVPYQLFETNDKPIVLAVGNDRQWQRCCNVLARPEWSVDPRFAVNSQRVTHRAVLVPLLQNIFVSRSAVEWLQLFEAAQVPASPVNTIDDVFADSQVQHEQLRNTVIHPGVGEIHLLGLPFELSETPTQIRLAPPLLGQHTEDVLLESGYLLSEVEALRREGVV
jgi:crotonobetainyl-CoA:carnitine CoA-transferase CaiB-like acyl-CoA transferase